jgi:hypothetical protein
VSRLRVVHTSTFRYGSAVLASYNEARMTPLSQQGQTVLETRIDVQPHTGWHEYRDYWGTAVSAFEVLTPHESDGRHRRAPGRGGRAGAAAVPAGWDTLRGAELRDRLAEFLSGHPTTAPPRTWSSWPSGARGPEPADAALAVRERLRDEMEYIPGVTTVHTPASEAWTGAARRRARTSRTWWRGAAVRSASPPGTSRATCTPTTRRRRHHRARRLARLGRVVGGRVVRVRRDEPGVVAATTTWCSPEDGLTTTSRRCAGSTPAPARRRRRCQVEITREA